MRHRSCSLAAALSLIALLALAVGPMVAKEGEEAQLDTPISRDAEPGSIIDVGWSVFAIVDGERHPVYGSPIYLRLVSPDGASQTEVSGRETPASSGHYVGSIAVPAGGIGEVIVAMVGYSCPEGGGCERVDHVFPLTDDPLVTGAAPAAPVPSSSSPSSAVGALVQLVLVGVAVAVAAGLAALIVGRRRGAEVGPVGR